MQQLYNFNGQPQTFTTESSVGEKPSVLKPGTSPILLSFTPHFLGLTPKPLSTLEINTVVKLLLPLPVSTHTRARLTQGPVDSPKYTLRTGNLTDLWASAVTALKEKL